MELTPPEGCAEEGNWWSAPLNPCMAYCYNMSWALFPRKASYSIIINVNREEKPRAYIEV